MHYYWNLYFNSVILQQKLLVNNKLFCYNKAALPAYLKGGIFMDSAKINAIKAAMGEIEKQFGKGAIMRLGEAGTKMAVGVIPTGSLGLDLALGVGGLPKGRIVEIFGPEGGGKTTLALHVIAEAQKRAGTAAFIDAEHALDPARAESIGVDLKDLLVSQPDTGEQALEIVETLVRSGAVDIVVVDSVAALVPRAEVEGEMGDAMIGLQARLMSQAMRKLASAISKSKTLVVFINQLREKVGIMFGNPEVTPGGRALKFYSSVRLDVRRVENISEGDRVIGNRVKVKVVKNKVAPPFRTAEFDIMFDRGISREGSLLDAAVDTGIMAKSGAWFEYNKQKVAQGRESAKLYLAENPKVYSEIDKKVREVLASGKAPMAVGPE